MSQLGHLPRSNRARMALLCSSEHEMTHRAMSVECQGRTIRSANCQRVYGVGRPVYLTVTM